jgi:hypothetical protein
MRADTATGAAMVHETSVHHRKDGAEREAMAIAARVVEQTAAMA